MLLSILQANHEPGDQSGGIAPEINSLSLQPSVPQGLQQLHKAHDAL
jgi:hypothetical protein